jgi:hypothetical protein
VTLSLKQVAVKGLDVFSGSKGKANVARKLIRMGLGEVKNNA